MIVSGGAVGLEAAQRRPKSDRLGGREGRRACLWSPGFRRRGGEEEAIGGKRRGRDGGWQDLRRGGVDPSRSRRGEENVPEAAAPPIFLKLSSSGDLSKLFDKFQDRASKQGGGGGGGGGVGRVCVWRRGEGGRCLPRF